MEEKQHEDEEEKTFLPTIFMRFRTHTRTHTFIFD